MSLREDFKDIGYEMIRTTAAEIEKIEKKASMETYYIREKFENQMQEDLLQLEMTSIRNRQYELNRLEMDRVSEINNAVAQRKTKYIDEFNELLRKEIRDRIQFCHKSYVNFLIEKVKNYLPLIVQPVKIQFHEDDLKLIKETDFLKKIGKKRKFFTISETPLDSCMGFRITAEDNEYEIDFTFKAIADNHRLELKMLFMKMFPLFEAKLRNAMEIDREKHGGAKRYEI